MKSQNNQKQYITIYIYYGVLGLSVCAFVYFSVGCNADRANHSVWKI
jgi:hypothetical protein